MMAAGAITLFIIMLILAQSLGNFIEDREVVCATDRMVITFNFRHPFSGVVFVQNEYGKSECRWRGNDSHFLLVMLPLMATTTNNNTHHCRVDYNEATGERSTTLIVSQDATILTEDAYALMVKCLPSQRDLLLTLGAPSLDTSSFHIKRTESLTLIGSGTAPSLSMRILDGHGLTGSAVSTSLVGQRLTMDIELKETAMYDMVVHDCIAHDGSRKAEASLALIDYNGCAVPLPRAVDGPVLQNSPQKNGAKHAYIFFYGFQFTSSEYVYFNCEVTPCVNSCERKQCDANHRMSVVTPRRNSSNQQTMLADYTLKAVLKISPPKLTGTVLAQMSPLLDNTSNATAASGLFVLLDCTELSWILLIVTLTMVVMAALYLYGWRGCFSHNRCRREDISLPKMVHKF